MYLIYIYIYKSGILWYLSLIGAGGSEILCLLYFFAEEIVDFSL